MPDLSDTLRKCRIGTAKKFTLLLLLYHTQANAVGMKHRPHDTRHTCVSLLTVAGVSDKVIKKIVGHKGQGVTEIVYTHFEIAELIDAINKI